MHEENSRAKTTLTDYTNGTRKGVTTNLPPRLADCLPKKVYFFLRRGCRSAVCRAHFTAIRANRSAASAASSLQRAASNPNRSANGGSSAGITPRFPFAFRRPHSSNNAKYFSKSIGK